MPRIPSGFLDCVVYIFPTMGDAKSGSRLGGTGFVVGIPFSANPKQVHAYIVTNAHVVEPSIAQNKSVIVRINLESGGYDMLEIEPSSWKLEPDGDDVAVCPIDDTDRTFRISTIDPVIFVRCPTGERHDRCGIGDDVFMVGRYIDHQGKVENSPTVRFGNIAKMPGEPVTQKERGYKQTGFLVEMRSASGFSGSPVFTIEGAGGLMSWGFSFLGVDCGHLPLRGKLVNAQGYASTEDFPEIDSMMAVVVPAWVLRDLLHDPEFVEQRRRDEEAVARDEAHGAVLDASMPPDDDGDFNVIAKRIVDQSTESSGSS